MQTNHFLLLKNCKNTESAQLWPHSQVKMRRQMSNVGFFLADFINCARSNVKCVFVAVSLCVMCNCVFLSVFFVSAPCQMSDVFLEQYFFKSALSNVKCVCVFWQYFFKLHQVKCQICFLFLWQSFYFVCKTWKKRKNLAWTKSCMFGYFL